MGSALGPSRGPLANVTAAFKNAAEECGLPVIRLHHMRHGACSLMLAGGVPIEIVQLVLGHASPEVARRIYAHGMKKATSALVETVMGLLTRHHRNAEEETDAEQLPEDVGL